MSVAPRALLIAATLVVSATTTAQSAPVEGERAAIDRFAGEWVGSYECPETGRSGTLLFRLAAGADSVAATVWMVPRATDANPAPDAIPLTVHHVAIEGPSFWGSLERYDDPEWELPLDTEFGGVLTGDGYVEGYFRSAGTRIDTVPQCGRWWATRTDDLFIP